MVEGRQNLESRHLFGLNFNLLSLFLLLMEWVGLRLHLDGLTGAFKFGDVCLSLFPVGMIGLLGEQPLLNLLGEMVVDFLHEVLPIKKPKLNVVTVEFPEVFLLTVLPAMGRFVLKPGNHFLMMAPALLLIPGSNEPAHLHVVALRLVARIVE